MSVVQMDLLISCDEIETPGVNWMSPFDYK